MTEYKPQQLDKKWQQQWTADRAFEVVADESRRKFYCLEMFAYPSIRALAHHIEGRSDADAAPRAAANRGRQAREQALRRRRAEVRPD